MKSKQLTYKTGDYRFAIDTTDGNSEMIDLPEGDEFTFGDGRAEYIDRQSPKAKRYSPEFEAATIFHLNGQEIGGMYQATDDNTLVVLLRDSGQDDVLPRSALDDPQKICQTLAPLFLYGLNKHVYRPGAQPFVLCDDATPALQHGLIFESLRIAKKNYTAQLQQQLKNLA